MGLAWLQMLRSALGGDAEILDSTMPQIYCLLVFSSFLYECTKKSNLDCNARAGELYFEINEIESCGTENFPLLVQKWS